MRQVNYFFAKSRRVEFFHTAVTLLVNIHHKKRNIRKHSHFFHSAHISLLHPGNGLSRKVYPGPAGFARKNLLFSQQRTCRTETATGSHTATKWSGSSRTG